jgi:hypothetical protein
MVASFSFYVNRLHLLIISNSNLFMKNYYGYLVICIAAYKWHKETVVVRASSKLIMSVV